MLRRLSVIGIALPMVFAGFACNHDSIPEHFEYGHSDHGLTKGTPGAENGDLDYCNDPGNTCVDGEGDCDGDAQCTNGNCGVDNGPQFGFGSGWDVCVPDYCENDVLDAVEGETSVDCGGPCGTTCTNPGTNGDLDYCSSGFTCSDGEGDCDSDAECTNGNCGINNGPQFGFGSGWDVCVPAHCENSVLDAAEGETSVDCGGPCGATCTNPGTNGDADYCSSGFTCSDGEGDCDSDAECTNGNCGVNNGPKFGFSSGHDVCVPAHCENGVFDDAQGESGVDCGGPCGSCTNSATNGDADYCSATFPCESGESDCDSDSECSGGLACGTDNGPGFGFPTGHDVCVPASCTNSVEDAGESEVDCGGSSDCGYCDASFNGGLDFCSKKYPCSEGQGDCDFYTVGDDDCAGDTICGTNNGAFYGDDTVGIDYCTLCGNGIQDSDEAGVDCGGSHPGCDGACPV